MSLGLVQDLNLGGAKDHVRVELGLFGVAAGCSNSTRQEQRFTGPGLLAEVKAMPNAILRFAETSKDLCRLKGKKKKRL